jgi:hypothetical protein
LADTTEGDEQFRADVRAMGERLLDEAAAELAAGDV